MGWNYEVRVSADIDAPPEAVWARVSNHEDTTSWVKTGLQGVTLLKEGTDARGGVGAMRSVKFLGWVPLHEEVLEYGGNAFAYTIRRGMPHVSDHLGRVIVEPRDGGSRLRWEVGFTFSPLHPFSWTAPVFVRWFRSVLDGAVHELKRQLDSPQPA